MCAGDGTAWGQALNKFRGIMRVLARTCDVFGVVINDGQLRIAQNYDYTVRGLEHKTPYIHDTVSNPSRVMTTQIII